LFSVGPSQKDITQKGKKNGSVTLEIQPKATFAKEPQAPQFQAISGKQAQNRVQKAFVSMGAIY
jgi:hypothetical protein